MRITTRHRSGIGAVLLLALTVPSVVLAQSVRVRWDIVNFAFSTPPVLSEGGIADAKAPDGTTLRLTGAGTFTALDGRRVGSGIATGGGAWQVLSPDGGVLASGTYRTTELVSFEFANLWPSVLNFEDRIGPNGASGNAVLLIEYSDGSQGVLSVLCSGPGAPAGISEAIAATKGFKPYYQIQVPAPGVNLNRTAFHILR